MSVSQSESEEPGDSETRTGRRGQMDLIGRSVTTQQSLLEERNTVTLLSYIQSFPDFENFLNSLSFDVLNIEATHGPVIVINQSRFPSNILILHKDSPPSVTSTPSEALTFKIARTGRRMICWQIVAYPGGRKRTRIKGLRCHSSFCQCPRGSVRVRRKTVIERLRQLNFPEISLVWWRPTSALCSLPLHAMGPIPSDDHDKVYFMDLFIPSYCIPRRHVR